jgi:hypothetical protein
MLWGGCNQWVKKRDTGIIAVELGSLSDRDRAVEEWSRTALGRLALVALALERMSGDRRALEGLVDRHGLTVDA